MFLLLSIKTYAQKQFKNNVSLSVVSEFVNEETMLFESYNIFTEKPMYGVKLGYERKLGKFVSIGTNATYLFGLLHGDVLVNSLQPENEETVETKSTFSRLQLQLVTQFWVIDKTKYAFTPGVAFSYGRTLSYIYSIEELSSKQKYSVNHQYANVSLQLTNRFTLKRLRSTNKGTYGELQLLVTPYAAANVYKNLDWKAAIAEPSHETLFGGGILLGLGFLF